MQDQTNEFHAMEPVWEPCGPGCACNDLTLICWGPFDGLELPARVEYHPDDSSRLRLYGEQGTLEASGRTFATWEAAAAERDRLNRSL